MNTNVEINNDVSIHPDSEVNNGFYSEIDEDTYIDNLVSETFETLSKNVEDKSIEDKDVSLFTNKFFEIVTKLMNKSESKVETKDNTIPQPKDNQNVTKLDDIVFPLKKPQPLFEQESKVTLEDEKEDKKEDDSDDDEEEKSEEQLQKELADYLTSKGYIYIKERDMWKHKDGKHRFYYSWFGNEFINTKWFEDNYYIDSIGSVIKKDSNNITVRDHTSYFGTCQRSPETLPNVLYYDSGINSYMNAGDGTSLKGLSNKDIFGTKDGLGGLIGRDENGSFTFKEKKKNPSKKDKKEPSKKDKIEPTKDNKMDPTKEEPSKEEKADGYCSLVEILPASDNNAVQRLLSHWNIKHTSDIPRNTTHQLTNLSVDIYNDGKLKEAVESRPFVLTTLGIPYTDKNDNEYLTQDEIIKSCNKIEINHLINVLNQAPNNDFYTVSTGFELERIKKDIKPEIIEFMFKSCLNKETITEPTEKQKSVYKNIFSMFSSIFSESSEWLSILTNCLQYTFMMKRYNMWLLKLLFKEGVRVNIHNYRFLLDQNPSSSVLKFVEKHLVDENDNTISAEEMKRELSKIDKSKGTHPLTNESQHQNVQKVVQKVDHSQNIQHDQSESKVCLNLSWTGGSFKVNLKNAHTTLEEIGGKIMLDIKLE